MTMVNRLQPIIQDATAQLRDLRPLMEEISQILDESVNTNFRNQRSPYGVDWAPHSPTTTALYAKGGFKGRTRGGLGERRLLVRTGALIGGIVAKYTSDTAHVSVSGRAVKYGYVHQFGNPANRLPNVRPGKSRSNAAPIPARPFMPITPEGVTNLPEEVLAEIKDAAAAFFSEFRG